MNDEAHPSISHFIEQKETATFRLRSLCWHYRSIPGRPTCCPGEESVQWTLFARIANGTKRNRNLSVAVIMLALPIFPGSRPPSIVGANELNFCVRDGNRWTLIAINTNSYGWGLPHLLYQCPSGFLVTHTGFEPMLTA